MNLPISLIKDEKFLKNYILKFKYRAHVKKAENGIIFVVVDKEASNLNEYSKDLFNFYKEIGAEVLTPIEFYNQLDLVEDSVIFDPYTVDYLVKNNTGFLNEFDELLKELSRRGFIEINKLARDESGLKYIFDINIRGVHDIKLVDNTTKEMPKNIWDRTISIRRSDNTKTGLFGEVKWSSFTDNLDTIEFLTNLLKPLVQDVRDVYTIESDSDLKYDFKDGYKIIIDKVVYELEDDGKGL